MFTKLLSIILIVVLALSFSTAVIAQEYIPGKAEPGNPLAEWLESFNDEMWTNFNKVPSPVLFPLNAQRQSREMSLEEMGSRVRATIDNALENLRNEVKVTANDTPRVSWVDRITELAADLLNRTRASFAGWRQFYGAEAVK